MVLPVEMVTKIISAFADGAETIAAENEAAGEMLEPLLRIALPALIEQRRRGAGRLADIEKRLAEVEARAASDSSEGGAS